MKKTKVLKNLWFNKLMFKTKFVAITALILL